MEEHAIARVLGPETACLRLKKLLRGSVFGQKYVFDPESANIFLITDTQDRSLELCQSDLNSSEESAKLLLEEIGFNLDSEAGETFHKQQGNELDSRKAAATIHLNHACNLACTYCYADGRNSDGDENIKGAYGGPAAHMLSATIQEAIEKLVSNTEANSVTIGFCGGEALLSESRFLEAVMLCESISRKYKKTINYELTTNATRLTPSILKVLKEQKFNVAVSIDGTRETHDRQRPMANGSNSYDKVIDGCNALAGNSIPFGVRMTAYRTSSSLRDDHYALAKTPAPAGNFKFHMYGADAATGISAAEEEGLYKHYNEIAKAILKGDENASKLTAVRSVVLAIITKAKSQFQCGAGRWDRAITPNGDVYPCHRFVGMEAYKMGNVNDVNFSFQSSSIFEDNAVSNRMYKSDGSPNCAQCYAQNICGGGCAQIGAANTGAIGEMPPFYCSETRLRVKAVVSAIVEMVLMNSHDTRATIV